MAQGSLGSLNIQIAANVAQLQQDVGKVEREMRRMSSAGVTASRKMDRAAKGIDGFKQVAAGVTSAIVAIKGLETSIRFMVSASQDAASFEQSIQSLDSVVKDLGMTGQEAFKQLKTASAGLVDDKSLVEAANRAISLGIKFEDLGNFMEIARAKARDMGTTTSDAFNDLVTALGRVSPMILDNLGITVKVGEANEIYAASIGKTVAQLTDQEKKLAFQKAALDAGRESLERHNLAQKTSAERWQELAAAAKSFALVFGDFVSPALETYTQGLLVAIRKTRELLESGSEGNIQRFGPMEELKRRMDARAAEKEQRKKDIAEREAAEITAEQRRINALREWVTSVSVANTANMQSDMQLHNNAMRIHNENEAAKKREIALDKAARNANIGMTKSILGNFGTINEAGAKSFRARKGLMVAGTLIDTYKATMDAWESAGNPYLGALLAASVFGAGMARVNAIRSTNPTGGGGGAIGGGSLPVSTDVGATPDVNAFITGSNAPQNMGQTTIVFQGGTFIGGDEDSIARDLTPGILKAIEDGQR